MGRQKRNPNEFPRGYIKTDPDGTQWMWLNGAFIHYVPMTKEQCIQMIKDSIKINSSELWKILLSNLPANGTTRTTST